MIKTADESQKTQNESQCHHINSAYPSPTTYPTFFVLHANRLQVAVVDDCSQVAATNFLR